MFIIYSHIYFEEVFVTTTEKEVEFLREYGEGRDFKNDFDREEIDSSVLEIRLNIDFRY